MSNRPRRQPARRSPGSRLIGSERAAAAPPEVRFRVDFNDRCSVGIGKVRLLEAIEQSGSLSRAARGTGMSYRRAWLLADSMNREFDTPVISATIGGSGGGGATLTPFGRELAAGYRRLEARILRITADCMGKFAAHVRGRSRGTAGGGPARKSLAKPLKGAG